MAYSALPRLRRRSMHRAAASRELDVSWFHLEDQGYSVGGAPAAVRLRYPAHAGAVEPIADRLAFDGLRSEAQYVPVGIGDVQLARTPWIVGRLVPHERVAPPELDVQRVRVADAEVHPAARVTLFALREHERRVAACHLCEAAVAPIKGEAEDAGVVREARVEIGDTENGCAMAERDGGHGAAIDDRTGKCRRGE